MLLSSFISDEYMLKIAKELDVNQDLLALHPISVEEAPTLKKHDRQRNTKE
jgi:hypothetical protein